MDEKVFDFYGVCGNQFKLNDTVWEAIEDEADGYRSYLETIKKVDSDGIFQYQSLAKVKVEKFNDNYTEGYKIIDIEDNHVWLEVGTANYNDYYPYFVFNYNLKVDEQEEDNENDFDNFIN